MSQTMDTKVSGWLQLPAVNLHHNISAIASSGI
jgi:hypothetical protein